MMDKPSTINSKLLINTLETFRIGVFKVDLSSMELNWDKTAYKVFGQNIDNFKPDIQSFLDIIYFEDEKKINEFFSNIINSKETTIEYRVVGEINNLKYIKQYCIPEIDEKANIFKATILVRDLTKEKENFLQVSKDAVISKAIQKISKIGYWSFDIVKNRFYWSDEMFKIFEYSENNFDPIYDDFIGLIHPDYSEKVNDLFVKSISENKEINYECKIITNMRNKKDVCIKSSRNEEDDAKRIIIGTIQDITKQKKTEKKLRKEKERAEKNERLKSEFLANMSHEVRTPLNGIIGFSDILKSRIADQELIEYCNIIQECGENLVSTFDNLLDISSLETNSFNLNKQEFSLNESINFLFQTYKKKVNESVKIEVCIDSSDYLLKSDKNAIELILSKFLDNSVKFTEKGKIIFGYIKQTEKTEFFVEDTGIGIDKDLRDKIFLPFTKFSDSNEKFYRGNGLGLAVAKKISDLLNGEIGIVAKNSKAGSRFYFKI